MAYDDAIQKEKHLGRNVQRIREIIGMKQSALADNMGMSQQNISKLESSAVIPEETLEKLAIGLGVNVEFIKNFSEEKAIYNIQNTYDNSVHNQHYRPTITNENAVNVITELFDKLLQAEKEKNELLAKTNDLLQQLLKEQKNK